MGLGAAIVGSAVIGGIGSKKAADAQKDAAREQSKTSKYIFDQQTELTAPFRQGGVNALMALQYELGLGERPTFGPTGADGKPLTVERTGQKPFFNLQTGGTGYKVGDRTFGTEGAAQNYLSSLGTEYGGFKATPSYDFRRQEGMNAIEGSAASRGGLFSGATGEALVGYGDALADQEYSNYLGRLGGMTGYGLTAANQQIAAGNNFVANNNNALANYGNAAAAGYMGMANAAQGGISNYIGWQALQGKID